MTPENFVYWLQGFLELSQLTNIGGPFAIGLNPAQVKAVSDHLSLVFKKETPSYLLTTTGANNSYQRNTSVISCSSGHACENLDLK